MAETKMNEDTHCTICHRLHDLDMPCSKNIANAFMGVPGSLEKLTDADKAWMKAVPINPLAIMEEAIADRIDGRI